MKNTDKKKFLIGAGFLAAFVLWTVLVSLVDIRAIGPNGSSVGFATLNGYVHERIGVNIPLYTITDWLGLHIYFLIRNLAFLLGATTGDPTHDKGHAEKT